MLAFLQKYDKINMVKNEIKVKQIKIGGIKNGIKRIKNRKKFNGSICW